MKKLNIILLLFLLSASTLLAANPLKVLAIGNSFSVDAVEQDLHSLASDGKNELIIGNLFIPGCSVDRHYANILGNKPEYSYRKIGVNGTADTIPDCTLRRALEDEKWDIITFQQSSHYSGMDSTFSHLPQLIELVRKVVGCSPRFMWHMTWAYAPDSDHSGFRNYDNNQMKMYEAIVETAKITLKNNPELKGIIPCGTAIQNARTTSLGEIGHNLTRDGYHLSLTAGRYIAACTWYGVLFGLDALEKAFTPSTLTPCEGVLARQAAKDAILRPFAITKIEHTVMDEQTVP